MGKLVILRLGKGSFEQGFPVTLQIGEEDARPSTEITGKLPPNPGISQAYQQWQALYQGLEMRPRLSSKPEQVTNITKTQDCHAAAQRLGDRFNQWLQAETFRPIREKWLEKLLPSDDVRVILQVEDHPLQKLPWHQWDLIERYPKAEIALGAPAYEQPPPPLESQTNVAVLAILGNSKGIDTQADRALLNQLPDADICWLIEPDRQDLTDRLWEHNWDILFFAGHSASHCEGETGRIYINQTDSLTISELKYGLKKALERGLRLAIFNSCDGLGLARDLADLHIPQIIVMREPVPDLVAQAFLKYFLEAFANGESLYLSVRQARERLQGMEDQFPCATWLPIICQNPAETPPTWQTLNGQAGQPVVRPIAHSLPRRNFAAVLLMSLLVTTTVGGLRFLGLLQASELQAFDQLMRLRPDERPDPRLLVVTIDDAEIQAQQRQPTLRAATSLSDTSLAQLLERLQQFKPRAIGLDLYRDFPVDSRVPKLAALMKQSRPLVGVCKFSSAQYDPLGIAPPPELSGDRLGFSDLFEDEDNVLRRSMLFMKPGAASPCQTPYSLAVQLAFRYLEAEKITPAFTADKNLRLGKTVFKRIQPRTGGYQGINASGAQTLLNYRSTQTIAEQVSLSQILSGQVDSNAIKDRVVLIGVTAKSKGDYWATPYQANRAAQMPGVVVQAHIVSEILSAVLDQRPLLWVWSPWLEVGWIGSWSLVGGIATWQLYLRRRSLIQLVLVISIATGALVCSCRVLLIQGGWVPLVPAALALVATSAGVMYFYRSQPIKHTLTGLIS